MSADLPPTAPQIAPPSAEALSTPSLRRRVTVLVLVAVAVLLAILVVATDRVLEARLEGQLRQRLQDRAAVGAALVDQVDGRDLARRLEGDGVSVVLTTSDGSVYAEGPLAGAALAGSGGAVAEPPGTPGGGGPGPGGPGDDGGPPAGPGATASVVASGSLLTITDTLSDGSRLELLADAADVTSTVRQARIVLALAALVVLLFAAAAVPWVVGRGLRPLGVITDAARSITDGDRGRRLRPTDPASDLGRTATAFDAMLDDITASETRARAAEVRLRTFLSDAAHDLRTPLTGAGAAAERVLRDDPPRPEREQALATLVREMRRASRLVDDMLLMSRIDAGLDERFEPLDLADVVRGVVHGVAEARRLTAPDAVRIDVVGADDAVPVLGDADRLARAVGNLVDNAVHAVATADLPAERRRVRVHLSVQGGSAVLDVRDDGDGVPAAERERIFERMVRLDQARGRAPGSGSGLGLPIARGITRAHGGDVVCVPVPDSAMRGAWFRLTLPAADAAVPAAQ